MTTFTASLRQVWKRRHGDADALLAKTKGKLSEAKTRKGRLVNALVDRIIDQPTYEERLFDLEAEFNELRRELVQSEAEYLDLEGVLAFAAKAVVRPSRVRLEFALDQRQRLQQVFFQMA